MTLEEILPHLRKGGRVKITTRTIDYDILTIFNFLTSRELRSNDFSIIEENDNE